jgi:hypothetical protein
MAETFSGETVFYALPALGVTFRFCRDDECLGLSSHGTVARVLASSLNVESDRPVDIGCGCQAAKPLLVRGMRPIMVLGGPEWTLLRQAALPLDQPYGG